MADVLIIGGGIAGLLAARELAMAGARVRLLDKSDTGRESTWAGGGIVSPLYPWRYPDEVTALARWGQGAFPALARELVDDTGIDPELIESGLLISLGEEAKAAEQWSRRHDLRYERVGSPEIAEIEPELAPGQPDSIWYPGISSVRNPRLARALRADVERRGVQVSTHTEFLGMDTVDQRVRGVHTSRGELTAKQLLICTGAWTGELLADTGIVLPVAPVKGQMLLFRTAPGTIRHIYLHEDRYVVPRRDGRVLFGSTVEHSGFDKSTSEDAHDELLGIAHARYPVLRTAELEHHWAGLRPGSPAGVPYIGRHPAFENLWVNAGHYRNGIVLGPASARLAADLVLGREPILDPRPYSLGDRGEGQPL